MATYIISEEYEIKRQEGDTADIEITVPASLPLAGFTIKFRVFNGLNTAVITKSSTSGITVVDQVITVTLATTDTEGYAGVYRWELELTSLSQTITIGRGAFIIIGTLIKSA